MRTEYIFPTVLIALDCAASIPYAVKCNWRMMIYWLAAAHSFPKDYVLTGNRGEKDTPERRQPNYNKYMEKWSFFK